MPGLEKPRAFSLANPEAERQLLELHVRRVAGGEATAWLHDELTVGAELRFSGPWGRFYVRKSDPKPLLFMAGGSGLSSPKSMILDLLQHQPERDVTLIYGARNRAELYYHELFLELAARHAHFTYLPALSEPLLEDAWQGEVGMVHEVARQAFDGRFQGRRAYLCGPPPMVEACIRALMQGRLFEKDIFTEKFVTAGDGEAGLARSPLFRSL